MTHTHNTSINRNKINEPHQTKWRLTESKYRTKYSENSRQITDSAIS